MHKIYDSRNTDDTGDPVVYRAVIYPAELRPLSVQGSPGVDSHWYEILICHHRTQAGWFQHIGKWLTHTLAQVAPTPTPNNKLARSNITEKQLFKAQ